MSPTGRRRSNPFGLGIDKHFGLRPHRRSHGFLLTQQNRYKFLNIAISEPRTFPPSAVYLIIYTTILLFNMFVPP
jgi:hypothetical protein